MAGRPFLVTPFALQTLQMLQQLGPGRALLLGDLSAQLALSACHLLQQFGSGRAFVFGELAAQLAMGSLQQLEQLTFRGAIPRCGPQPEFVLALSGSGRRVGVPPPGGFAAKRR